MKIGDLWVGYILGVVTAGVVGYNAALALSACFLTVMVLVMIVDAKRQFNKAVAKVDEHDKLVESLESAGELRRRRSRRRREWERDHEHDHHSDSSPCA